MKVLAVDPGYDRLGVAVVEKQDGQEVVLFSGCITTDKLSPLPDRLYEAGQSFAALLDKYKPDAVGIETIFFNNNQKTAIGVAAIRGTIIYLAKAAGKPVFEFGPQEIKVAVTGYGKSDKQAVIDMVKRLAKNVPDGALDDEYDAIAIGITTIAHKR